MNSQPPQKHLFSQILFGKAKAREEAWEGGMGGTKREGKGGREEESEQEEGDRGTRRGIRLLIL